MERRVINPWGWQEQFGFVQGNEIRGAQRVLVVSGQTSIDGNGHVAAEGDICGQLAAALDNLETVLSRADMTLTNLVQLNVYTTDMDRFLGEAHTVLTSRLAGCQYTTTYLGVARLALPQLLIEIEATAAT